MRLTIVGCSGSYPGPGASASCYLLEEEHEGRTWRILLDLGNGALGQLHRYADPLDVDAVLAAVPKRRRPDVFTVTTAMWTAMHGITSLRISKPDFVWPPVEEQVEAILWPWREALRADRT